jgi:hypothetical protein
MGRFCAAIELNSTQKKDNTLSTRTNTVIPHLHCHSERSEESLFGVNPRKERFIAQETCDGKPYLTPQTTFGMTEWCYFRQLSSRAAG